MFLLDTNVVSEMRRQHPDISVKTWIENQPGALQFISVITLTEIASGIASQADPLQRHRIQKWLNETLRPWFQLRILTLDEEIAENAGTLAGTRQRAGKPLSLPDAYLAATAIKYRLVLVTRNTKDFVELPVDVYDPWTNTLTAGAPQ